WLNDNCVFTYFLLLAKHRPGIHVVDPLVIESLRKAGPLPKKWLPTKDYISNLRYILIPVNDDNHWTLGVVNIVQRRIEFYNSLVEDVGNLRALQQRITHFKVFVDKLGKGLLNCDKWGNYWLPDAPQQQNQYDCGIFVCKTAEIVSREGTVEFDVSSTNIFNIRCRMILEIETGKLEDHGED
ncbi:cysteine proteinase, partial [Wilcoxina mikolae CBS 423.85]